MPEQVGMTRPMAHIPDTCNYFKTSNQLIIKDRETFSKIPTINNNEHSPKIKENIMQHRYRREMSEWL